MSKSLEKIRDIKSLINEVYQDELNEGARKSWLVFQQYCDDIKQDLELLEQLKQQRDSLAINNGELIVSTTRLKDENQELKHKLGKVLDSIIHYEYTKERCKREKLEKAIEIIIREKIKPSAFIGTLRNYKEVYKVDMPYERACILLDCNITEKEFNLLKEVLE